jgi:hypothetical protein
MDDGHGLQVSVFDDHVKQKRVHAVQVGQYEKIRRIRKGGG